MEILQKRFRFSEPYNKIWNWEEALTFLIDIAYQKISLVMSFWNNLFIFDRKAESVKNHYFQIAGQQWHYLGPDAVLWSKKFSNSFDGLYYTHRRFSWT